MRGFTLYHIGGCPVKVDILFAVVLLVAIISGYGFIFIMAFAVVLVHEFCHGSVAMMRGYKLREIMLLPFGGVAQIENLGQSSPADETLIAVAGPLINLVLAAVARALFGLFSPQVDALLQLFFMVNMSMAIINLFPALPLDGGRIFRGLLSSHLGRVNATRICAGAGIVLGGFCWGWGIWGLFHGTCNISVFLLGAFLVIAAWDEYRKAPYLTAEVLITQEIQQDKALGVRNLAVAENMELSMLVRNFLPGMYHIITVVDAKGGLIGTVHENQILEQINNGSSAEPIGSLLHRKR